MAMPHISVNIKTQITDTCFMPNKNKKFPSNKATEEKISGILAALSDLHYVNAKQRTRIEQFYALKMLLSGPITFLPFTWSTP